MQWFVDLFNGKPELAYRSTSTSGDGDESSSYEDQRTKNKHQLALSSECKKQALTRKSSVPMLVQQPVLQAQAHVTHMILEVDDYFRACRYQGHQKALAQCYDRYAPHSPLLRYAKYERRFCAVPHLCGLEYLMPAGGGAAYGTNTNESSSTTTGLAPPEFPAIYLAQPSGARRVDGSLDATYLVSRQLDYMYHYIIEMALMGSRRDWRIPDAMHRQRQLYRTQRMKAYAPCPIQHATREQSLFCPHESVVYTRRTSAFFTQCMALLRSNPLLMYQQQGEDDALLGILPISYNLVSFLCGPLVGPGAQEGHDQWVIVPVYFIDLWNALRRPAEQQPAPRNNTNNDIVVTAEPVGDTSGHPGTT